MNIFGGTFTTQNSFFLNKHIKQSIQINWKSKIQIQICDIFLSKLFISNTVTQAKPTGFNNTECNQLKPITKFVWRRLGHGSTHYPSDLLWISRYVFIIAMHCHIVKKKSTHLNFIFERFPIFLNTKLFFSRRLIKSEKWPRPSSSLKY